MKRFIAVALMVSAVSAVQAVSVQELLNQGKVFVSNDGVLDLSGMNITDLTGLNKVPNPKSVIALKLAKNQISVLKKEFFLKFKKLKEIDLSYNNIQQLVDDYFEDNEMVQKLNLAHNKISKITRDAFDDLHSLIHLDLSFNKLSLPKFSGSAFHDVKKNIKVKLGGNPLSKNMQSLMGKFKKPNIHFVK